MILLALTCGSACLVQVVSVDEDFLPIPESMPTVLPFWHLHSTALDHLSESSGILSKD